MKSLKSSTLPTSLVHPVADAIIDANPSPVSELDTPPFQPPPLPRLPSDVLKERRKQELIDRKSSRHKSSKHR